jgi:hypothetical protein
MFNAPIPGESLTTEPKSMPYERPPEIADPIEALDKHIESLSREEAMEDALFFLEMGVPLTNLTEGILRSAVMEGIHSVDVSLIIAPVVHEFIRKHAIAADIDFTEGFDDQEQNEAIRYERDTLRAKNMLRQLREQGGDVPEEPEMVMEKEAPEEELMMEEEPTEAPKGLMARV